MQLFRAILNRIVYETGADGKIIVNKAAASLCLIIAPNT